MEIENRKERKLGGFNTHVQCDETILHFKCKSHRGRSPHNHTDVLCIAEVNVGITRVWAEIIANKESRTIIPIICEHVISGSSIHTDEHKSYKALVRNGFLHKTVCHKYEFVEKNSGIHTQHIESFHNSMKLEIKARKGIKTGFRNMFLTEFIWRFNRRGKVVEELFNLIKV